MQKVAIKCITGSKQMFLVQRNENMNKIVLLLTGLFVGTFGFSFAKSQVNAEAPSSEMQAIVDSENSDAEVAAVKGKHLNEEGDELAELDDAEQELELEHDDVR